MFSQTEANVKCTSISDSSESKWSDGIKVILDKTIERLLMGCYYSVEIRDWRGEFHMIKCNVGTRIKVQSSKLFLHIGVSNENLLMECGGSYY